MRPKKYTDFIVSAPFKRLAKHLPSDGHDTRDYVTITCPHCLCAFKDVLFEHVESRKADECLCHLRVCAAAAAAGVKVEPRRKRRAVGTAPSATTAPSTQNGAAAPSIPVGQVVDDNVSIQQQLDAMRQENARERERASHRHKVMCAALGISDHSSDDEDTLAMRANAAATGIQEATQRQTYVDVAKSCKLSPPRDGEATDSSVKRLRTDIGRIHTTASAYEAKATELAHVDSILDTTNRGHQERVRVCQKAIKIHADNKRLRDERREVSEQLGLGVGSSHADRMRALQMLTETQTEHKSHKELADAVVTFGEGVNWTEKRKMHARVVLHSDHLTPNSDTAKAAKVLRSKWNL